LQHFAPPPQPHDFGILYWTATLITQPAQTAPYRTLRQIKAGFFLSFLLQFNKIAQKLVKWLLVEVCHSHIGGYLSSFCHIFNNMYGNQATAGSNESYAS
jgi:hypothetical protein